MKADLWPAYWAGVWLCMESSIGRIVIFFVTGRTHWENLHRSLWPVVGNAFYNGVSWTAVGTVYKRIVESAVTRVE